MPINGQCDAQVNFGEWVGSGLGSIRRYTYSV